jgi:hypothetical protein
MYQGSSTELGNDDVAKFGTSVVLHLSQRLSTPEHQIFMDNYFTTYQILELLKPKGMNAAGTIRVNRFNKPPHLSDPVTKRRERGYSDEVTNLYAMPMLTIHQAAIEELLRLIDFLFVESFFMRLLVLLVLRIIHMLKKKLVCK